MRPPRAALGCIGGLCALMLLAVPAGCGGGAGGAAAVRVLTHRDFFLPTEALEAFTEQTGIKVVVFREDTPNDVIELLDRSRAHPVADVVIGVDTLDLSYVTSSGLTEPYAPLTPGPLVEGLAVAGHAMTPVSYLDACLNYLPSFYRVPQRRIDELPDPDRAPPPLPRSLDALEDPSHASTAVVPDAGTSRMGVYLLLALERRYPERSEETTPWPQMLDRMLRDGLELAPSWEAAVFERFAGGGQLSEEPAATDGAQRPEPVTLESLDGLRPLTWGTTGLPSVFARFQPGLPADLDIAVVTEDCVRIAFFVGVVAGAQNASLGGRFIDAVGEPLFQAGVSDRFGTRPARGDIVSSPEWRRFGVTAVPYQPDPAYIGAHWREWQLTWNQVVHRFRTGPPPPEPEVTITLPDDS